MAGADLYQRLADLEAVIGTSGVAVLESLFNANTVLAANSDDTPVAVTVAEQTLLGRITAGNIAALTASQVRTLLGLVIGTNVQAWDADLDAIAALTSAANKVPYSTGAQAWALADFIPGVWTTYVPQIDQGVTTSITKTDTYARWMRIGRTVHVNFYLSVTGAGTAGSVVTATLPVTAAVASGVVGAGFFYDSSAGQLYSGAWGAPSTTQTELFADQQSGFQVGIIPNVALANGDQLRASITYEAAS